MNNQWFISMCHHLCVNVRLQLCLNNKVYTAITRNQTSLLQVYVTVEHKNDKHTCVKRIKSYLVSFID